MRLTIRDEVARTVLAGVGGACVGAGLGYLFCLKKYERDIRIVDTLKNELELKDAQPAAVPQEDLTELITTINQVVDLNREAFGAIMEKLDEALSDAIASDDIAVTYGGDTIRTLDTERPSTDERWDQEAEEADRGTDAPYVISVEEWAANKTGFSQQTLEWYSGDKTLCDEDNVPVYNPEKIVGRLEFGRGSGNPDVVYVRNPSLKAEYEIVRNRGSYMVEVMGVQAEEIAAAEDLKHSQQIRKFRD